MHLSSVMRRMIVILLIGLMIAPVAAIHAAPDARQGCGTAPAPRLTVGQQGRVTISKGVGNNLRTTFSTTTTVLGVMGDGEVFDVIGGPQCAENFWWWQVRRWDGQTGWTAEGKTGEYWVEPWPIVGAPLASGPRPNLPNVLIAYLSGATTGNIYLPYAMLADGTNILALGNIMAHDNILRWSPDGTRIAMADNTDIYIITITPPSLVNVTNTPATTDYGPTWSPDGMRLAYVSQETGNPDIFGYSSQTQTRANLTNNPANDIDPAWSPDGTRIAFASDRDGNMEIYVMSAADGANPQRLTNNGSADRNPVWSPDGRQIAFVSTQPDGRSDVYEINPDGSGLIALTSDGKGYRDPAWAPDNQRIAFVGTSPTTPGADALFSVRRDATDRMQYTTGAGQIAGVSWSPDGQWLAFANNPGGAYDIFAIHANGVNLVNLTNTPASNDTWPLWQPRTASNVVLPPGGAPVATTQPVNPASQDLLLIYNTTAPAFTLQNVSGRPLNLNPLVFTGAGKTVPATIWKDYTSSPLDTFKPIGCLMIWPFGIPNQPAPAECGTARQGWVENAQYIFWTQGSFSVSYNGVQVATCNTTDGRCIVDLP